MTFMLLFSPVISSEFGELLSRKMSTVNINLSQCKWYLFPHEMKRMLIIVLTNTQQPMIVCGFGNIPCSRETSKKVRFQWTMSTGIDNLIKEEFPLVIRSKDKNLDHICFVFFFC